MSMDRKIKKKTWTWPRIGILLGVIVLASFLISAFYKDIGTSRLNVKSDHLLVDTIHHGVFKEFITLFGVVEPIKTVYIDAIESGRVEEIYLEDGAMVNKNSPVLRLSNVDLQLNVLNQEARIVDQISTIRNQSILMEQQSLNLREEQLTILYRLDQLEKALFRNKKLYRDSVIAQVEFEETEDEYEHLIRREKLLGATIKKDSLFQLNQQNQMENTLDLMRRNLEFATTSLENLTIKVPIDGQLSSLDLEVGELINRGDRIAQVDVLNNYKMRASIDEYYIRRVFPALEATFEMDGQVFTLAIKKIYPTVTNGDFEVDLVFKGKRPENIKRGQSIPIKLSLSDETRSKLLAKGGFFNDTGGSWVYVIDPKTGNARKREIRLGRQNPNFFEVTSGLEEGEVVIVSNYENFAQKDELVLK